MEMQVILNTLVWYNSLEGSDRYKSGEGGRESVEDEWQWLVELTEGDI